VLWPSGQQDARVQPAQLNQAFDACRYRRVIAERCEEGRPVPRFHGEEVLAVASIGEDAINVEDDDLGGAHAGEPSRFAQITLSRPVEITVN
jgi:hypothetical protein